MLLLSYASYSLMSLWQGLIVRSYNCAHICYFYVMANHDPSIILVISTTTTSSRIILFLYNVATLHFGVAVININKHLQENITNS